MFLRDRRIKRETKQENHAAKVQFIIFKAQKPIVNLYKYSKVLLKTPVQSKRVHINFRVLGQGYIPAKPAVRNRIEQWVEVEFLRLSRTVLL